MTRTVVPDRMTESQIAQSSPLRDGAKAPLHIMHVIDRLDVGGTEKVVMKLLQGLDSKVFTHSICTLRGAATDIPWASGIEVLDAGTGQNNFQFNVWRLTRIMKSLRPHVVHCRNWGAIEAIPAARMARIPVVIHSEHGYQLEMSAGLPLRQRVFRHIAYRWSTAVLAVTQELRQYHAGQAWWRPDAIRVLYNGVDEERFKYRPEIQARIRGALGISLDASVVGFVGRMVALKSVTTLLQAVEMLIPAIPNLFCLLVGSGPEVVTLQKYVSATPALHGRVIFFGNADNVPELLNAMDIFVLPSLMEGMSNTLLEALASGLPVVATRVGGNPEIVDESRCGYLFEPGNAVELSERLGSLLRDKEMYRNFSKAARQRAVREFSLSGMLRRYSELYLELAAQSGVISNTDHHVWN